MNFAHDTKYNKNNKRPPECGACYARIRTSDPYKQYLIATDFSPGLRRLCNGLIIAQKRVGKNYKEFEIYKLRTMRDDLTTESLIQTHVSCTDNPRVTKLGSYLRKYWIDELPQIVNLFKGDIKLIGLRAVPLAINHVFPQEFRKERSKMKPGLISIA